MVSKETIKGRGLNPDLDLFNLSKAQIKGEGNSVVYGAARGGGGGGFLRTAGAAPLRRFLRWAAGGGPAGGGARARGRWCPHLGLGFGCVWGFFGLLAAPLGRAQQQLGSGEETSTSRLIVAGD